MNQDTALLKDTPALSRAKEIAGEGKYENIVKKLREDGLLSVSIETFRNTYSNRLSVGYFHMTESDFEMLAVLGLYDMHTLEHSIRTFELAHRIITQSFLLPFGKTIVFGDFLSSANISRDQFLRAALFHDIGKIIIPREILHNALDDEEVLAKMFPEENLQTEGEQAKKITVRSLYENGIRPIEIIPLKDIFTGETYAELLCELEKRGCTEMATLKDVIRMHEPESKRVLISAGYAAEGQLAGTHHNYKKETHTHIMRTPYGTFAVADLIRIADATDALRSARWYKRPLSELEALFILIHDAKQGKIDSFLARVWVGARYKELQLMPRPEKSFLSAEEEKEEVRFIEEFLEEKETKGKDKQGIGI